jgi:paraquat-inducible protein A
MAERPLSAGLQTCACCGLAQWVEPAAAGLSACCGRCGTRLHDRRHALRSNALAGAIALAALILYPVAVMLPMLRIERFGHMHESSILNGTFRLLAEGQLLVGVVVLLCSIVLPLAKLFGILTLAYGGVMLRREHRAVTYRIVEWTGRWGMLDVLLVSILVAVVKLGDMVEVSAGPAALSFAVVVILSLLATACFDPYALWDEPQAADGSREDAS